MLRSRSEFRSNAAFLQWADRFVFTAGREDIEEIFNGLLQPGLITEATLVALWIETLEKYGQGLPGYGEVLIWLKGRSTAATLRFTEMAAPSVPRKPSTAVAHFPE